MSARADFVSCDWGSTRFRLRLVERAGARVLREHSVPMGIKHFAYLAKPQRSSAMARFLGEQLDAWPGLAADTPIIISGMASSSLGWRELPYARVPFALDGSGVSAAMVSVPLRGGSELRALLVSGVRTDDDIMRGEECHLLGAYALPESRLRNQAAMVFLLGTHPKHAVVRAGKLVAFRTHFTGELFEAIHRATMLGTSLPNVPPDSAPDLAAFREGLTFLRRNGLTRALFAIRTRHVLGQKDPAANYWFLSGVLLGAELSPPFERPAGTILFIGDARRADLYRVAFDEFGFGPAGDLLVLTAEATVVAGHAQLLGRYEEVAGT